LTRSARELPDDTRPGQADTIFFFFLLLRDGFGVPVFAF
jgi:hypothetical protein